MTFAGRHSNKKIDRATYICQTGEKLIQVQMSITIACLLKQSAIFCSVPQFQSHEHLVNCIKGYLIPFVLLNTGTKLYKMLHKLYNTRSN